MPQRKNDPTHPFVAKRDDGNRSRITFDTPGIHDSTDSAQSTQEAPLHKPDADEQAQQLADEKRAGRQMQIEQRGGLYSDKIKREPYSQMDKTFKQKQPIEKI